MKFAIERTKPAIRKTGELAHTHPPAKTLCFCREGTDLAFSQGMASVWNQQVKEEK